MSRTYPAKLLLFGEYTVLHGSQALAVPFHKWSGVWRQSDKAPVYDPVDYYRWLLMSDLIDEGMYSRMIDDHNDGWQYEADIPMGYGVGSSGAFVAAIYDRYFHSAIKDDVEKQTSTLSKMEAWFHGASSGMDPLVSYRDHAVYKDHSGKFLCIKDPDWPDGVNVYLLDTGIVRNTSPLVRKYKEMMSDEQLLKNVQRELIPMVDHAIHLYLQRQIDMLATCLQTISVFQRKYFSEMIPVAVRSIWDELTSMKGVSVKLCGAGGGGYYMVIDTHQHTFAIPYPLISVNVK